MFMDPLATRFREDSELVGLADPNPGRLSYYNRRLVNELEYHEVPTYSSNDFARVTGRLAKTDALDAVVLAHFGEAIPPPVRPLRNAETQLLNSLVARRHQLIAMLVAENNRLRTATTAAARLGMKSHIE